MQHTKEQILALLKRNGGHSVNELATELNLAPVTVRQHLTHLERDGLLIAERTSPSGGRAHYVFRLTSKANAEAFPYRSDRLVELLVREIGFLDGSELNGLSKRQKTYLVLQRLGRRLADEYASLLQGWPLRERIVFVTEVMRVDGGFAEWKQTAQGYEVRDFNCLFRRLLHGDSCEWHTSFLSRMLGADVDVQPHTDGGSQCCRYIIQPIVTAKVGAVVS